MKQLFIIFFVVALSKNVITQSCIDNTVHLVSHTILQPKIIILYFTVYYSLLIIMEWLKYVIIRLGVLYAVTFGITKMPV